MPAFKNSNVTVVCRTGQKTNWFKHKDNINLSILFVKTPPVSLNANENETAQHYNKNAPPAFGVST